MVRERPLPVANIRPRPREVGCLRGKSMREMGERLKTLRRFVPSKYPALPHFLSS